MDPNKGKMIERYARKLVHEERGITGLETAIVLIAFVVVAAVFAFTVLTTGLFTSEKAKETAMAGVAATSSTLTIKGSVTAIGGPVGTGCCNRIDHIRVKITGATDVNAVAFNPEGILVTYQDDANVSLMTFQKGDPSTTAGATACRGTGTDTRWCIVWRNANNDLMMEPGELAELFIFTANLTPAVTTNKQFRIEVIPQEGAPIAFQRRTPLALAPVMNLD